MSHQRTPSFAGVSGKVIQEVLAKSGTNPDYRRYRSAEIHEWGAELDEGDFFGTTSVYWKKAPVHSHRFLKIQFPAIVLLSLLKRSIEAYKRELQETHKLPFGIWIGSRLGENFLDRRSIFPRTPARLAIR